jgi:hypothetical protein
MVAVNTSYPNFSAGELSPKMRGRHDLAAYYSGMRRCENFIVDSVGPATFRPGMIYANTTEGNGAAFLYTFEFTDGNSFILEFTDLKLRFYRNNGLVMDGSDPYEIETPYTVGQVFQLKFAQQENTLYIAHPSHNPQKLVYTNPTSWDLDDHSPVFKSLSGPQGISAITKANPAVVTYTGDDSYTNGDIVRLTNIGGMVELNDEEYEIAAVNTTANTFQLVGVNSTTFATYTSGGIIRIVESDPAPFLTTDNFPGAVGFYEQRLVYAGSNNSPNTMWFSKSAELDDFSVGTEVDDGIQYTIAGPAIRISWLRGTNKFLAVGTQGDVFQVTGGIDQVITPTSISIRPSNSYGVSNINPIGRGTQVFYMQNNGLTLRSFEYRLDQDSYVPVDRNIVADHITSSGVTQIVFQDGRPNIIWCAKNNGELIGMTVEDEEAVSGWHRHSTDGDIISIATLPRFGQVDQLWLCVKRNIDGMDMYSVEYLSDKPEYPERSAFVTGDRAADDQRYRNVLFEHQKQYIHVDSSLSYYGDLVADESITPAAVTGDSVIFTTGASFFDVGMVGRQIWKKSVDGTQTGRAEILDYISGTQVECRILEEFDSTDAIAANNWYLTAGTLSGLDHLEGKLVRICADGGQHEQLVVTGGSVTLSRQVSVVHVGIGYDGYIETNELEGGGVTGPAQTKKKSLYKIGFRFLDTLYCKYGTGYYNLVQMEFRTSAMQMDRPPLLFTGDRVETFVSDEAEGFDAGWSRSKRAIISQDQPFPCNVQLLIPYFNVSN